MAASDKPDNIQQLTEPKAPSTNNSKESTNDTPLKMAKTSMINIKSQMRPTEIYLEENFRTAVQSLRKILSDAIDAKESNKEPFLLQQLIKCSIEYETIEIFCQTCTEILNKNNSIDNSGCSNGQIDSLFTMMIVYLVNGSHDASDVCSIISNQTFFLKAMSTILVSWKKPHFEGRLQQPEILESIVTVLHNVAVFDENVPKLRAANVIECMKPYLDSTNNTVRLLTLATLADLVNESESEMLRSNDDIINFLMSTISKAMTTNNRISDGWSLKELARIVRQVARNDNNKRTVVQRGAVPLLVKLTESNVIEEQIESVAAIWTLSFDKDNQMDMRNNKDWQVTETLDKLSNTTDENLKKIIRKAVWTIKGSEVFSKDIIKQTDKTDTHVMISYNWGYQHKVTQIRDNLRDNGIKIWMDLDNMRGSTVESMASAVENADIVLVCYSSGYKKSNNCHAEAMYAFKRKKTIIPVLMEENYEPDGWLGFILGTQLMFDFSGRYRFEDKIKELIREIKESLNKQNSIGELSDAPIIVQGEHSLQRSKAITSGLKSKEPSTSIPDIIRNWSAGQVEKWLENNDLSQFSQNLRGKDIAFLYILRHESPDTFYRIIWKKLTVPEIKTMADLRFAMENFELDHAV